MLQEYTSKETSISTVNSIYKKGYFKQGDKILDYGGGKYDKNIEYMDKLGVVCKVYDPYNRSLEHNKKVLQYFEDIKGADIVVCSNVLCVIKEDDVILNILKDIKSRMSVKEGSGLYIQIYEGNKTGLGKKTSKGYQRNQKTIDYLPFIVRVFEDEDIIVKGNIIIVKLGGVG